MFGKMMKALLLLPIILLLCGCPAGLAPLVGYPIGSTVREPEKIASRPAGPMCAAAILYRQDIDHNYRLLLSPDGGRSSIPLKTSYRYYLRTGSGEMQELAFLRSDPGMGDHPAEYLRSVVPHSTRDIWIGFGLCAGESDFDSSGFFPETDAERTTAEKKTSKYFIEVFSATKLLARVEAVAMTRKPGIECLAARNAVRFRGPEGWMLYLADENRIIKDPNQALAPTP